MRVANRPSSANLAVEDGIFHGAHAKGHLGEIVLATSLDDRVGRAHGVGEGAVELRHLDRQPDQAEARVRVKEVVDAIERLHRAGDEVAVVRAAIVGAGLFDRLAHRQRVAPVAARERNLHSGA